jgi:hypothetical protein
MKRLICVILAAGLCCSPALGHDRAATGTKAKLGCGIKGTPVLTEAQNAERHISPLSPNEIIFDANFVDSTGAIRPVRFSLEIHIVCDLPHVISVQSVRGGLIDAGEIALIGHRPTRHIDYRATLAFANRQSILATNATPGIKSTPIRVGYAIDARADFVFEADHSTKDENIPTEQGAYGDVIAIEIGPMI